MPASPKEIHNAIRTKFRVKRRDIPPFTGWLKPSTRADLYEVMNDLGCFKTGAEIGVALGKNAQTMLDTIDDLNLTCVDPWTPYSNHSQEKMDRRYQQTLARLKPYVDGGRAHIFREESMETVRRISDGFFDFIYIDGFHDFDWVMSDLIFWAKKVRPGGLIIGHDYYPFFRAGVMTAVDAYVKAHNIHDWYVTREKEPSWFWVK
jgi:predicted O-methyltransferase YrrM